MVRVVNEQVKGHLQTIVGYTLLQQEAPTKQLAIILPGKGYTAQAPLLYFSTSLLFNKNFDVLHVKYNYETEDFSQSSNGEQTAWIEDDMDAILNDIFTKYPYDKFIMIGKSIGTLAMSYLMQKEVFKSALAVWLTPLLTRDSVFLAMQQGEQRSLAAIGDRDPFYQEGRFKEIVKKNPHLQFHLIPDANHSLDHNDPFRSIDTLKTVIKEIEQFTKTGHPG